jgi:hypothetical protein
MIYVAETKGFEPLIRFPVYTLSRRAPSTTRTSLLFKDCKNKGFNSYQLAAWSAFNLSETSSGW